MTRKQESDNNAQAIWILTIILDLLAVAMVYFGIKDHVSIGIVVPLVILIEIASWGSRIALTTFKKSK